MNEMTTFSYSIWLCYFSILLLWELQWELHPGLDGAVSRTRWMVKTGLHNFLTSNTRKFFNILFCNNSTVEDNISFLNEDPEVWSSDTQYIRAEAIVNN